MNISGRLSGPAYPQQDMLTELNGFRTLTKINWENVTINNEITDIRWIDKDNDALIAPAVESLRLKRMVVNMTNNDTIMLRHYVPQDYSMLEAFQLSESDLKFVKTPEENITAAMSDNERYPSL